MKRILRDIPVAQPRLALRSARPAAPKAVAAVHAAPAPASWPMSDPTPPSQAAEVALDLTADVRARAEKAGYDEGYRRGTAQARADLEAEWRKLERAAAILAEAQQLQASQAADLAAEFAYTVACRILGQQAAAPDAVRGAAQAVLGQVATAGQVLRVHPQDAPLLERLAGQLGGVAVRPDAGVILGGCILEHAHGSLDARIETQLEELKCAVLALRAREAA